ncbi:MAG: hypothetical protein EPGJADBJ_04415 [Saprospiraceae bacterium]|nr:hypothetical protein [Saprospiraceae bacterium]
MRSKNVIDSYGKLLGIRTEINIARYGNRPGTLGVAGSEAGDFRIGACGKTVGKTRRSAARPVVVDHLIYRQTAQFDGLYGFFRTRRDIRQRC